MREKKTFYLVENIAKLLGAFVEIGSKLKTLFYLEGRLAKKSLPFIVLLTIFLLAGLITTWGILLTSGVFLLHVLFQNWIAALLTAMLINILLIILILKKLRLLIENIQFKHTRKHLFQWRAKSPAREIMHE